MEWKLKKAFRYYWYLVYIIFSEREWRFHYVLSAGTNDEMTKIVSVGDQMYVGTSIPPLPVSSTSWPADGYKNVLSNI